MKKRKRNLLYNIILVIAVLVFLYSAYQLIQSFAEYRKGDKEYEEIVKQAVEIEAEPKKPAADEGTKVQEEEEVFVHSSLQIDFETLLKRNRETVGWLQFDRPEKINYPLVQAEDNDKYLKTTFDGRKNIAGAIFVDAGNESDFSDRNTFIYGHNMKNGSMFGQLRKYREKEYWEENPYFYIYTLDGKEVKYHIFAVCVVEDTSRSYTAYFADEAQYLEYLKYVKSIARYSTGVDVNENSEIVSLSTCTNVTDTQRLIVHGVKISGE